MKFIRTLLGDIEPEKLGVTYSHEHIVCNPPYWKEKGDVDYLLDDVDKSLAEVKLFKNEGGESIIDATVIDYGREVGSVAEISKISGVNIVGTTGFNKSFLWSARMPGKNETFGAWIERSSINDLRDYMVNEIEGGLDGTEFKAGQIKFGTGYNSITSLEIKTIKAAVLAYKITSAPVHAHLEAGTMALEQIEILKDEGFDLHNISFGHMDRNPDPYIHKKVAQTGAFICFDGLGKVKYHPDSLVIDLIFSLVKNGFQKQILVSGDTARRSYYKSYSEAIGLPFILKSWRPRLIDESNQHGFDGEELVKDIFINNPKNCFSFKN
jgi:phosphotriesterase-related protein